jgi:hypothetical protein
MNVLMESQIQSLTKLGFDETNANIMACSMNGKEELANGFIELERENMKILEEQTFKYLVPIKDKLEEIVVAVEVEIPHNIINECPNSEASRISEIPVKNS